MHIVVCESSYAKSVWCKKILHGLKAELKKRREPYAVTEEVGEIAPDDTVFILGSGFGWLKSAVSHCNARGVCPVVLCNFSGDMAGGRYHQICSDVEGSMRQLIAQMREQYGERIALYGINTHSVGDRARADAFLPETPVGGKLFVNEGSLSECFKRFLPRADTVDTVLCANGFAAVSLVKHLKREAPALLSRLHIISCDQTLLSRYYQPHITSVDLNFEQFGKAAISVAELAKKQPYLSGLTAKVRWTLSGEFLPATATVAAVPPAADEFYEDEELLRLLTVENLLQLCDETDAIILDMLLRGDGYEAIAAACFLTEGAVKYRVKKMRELCGTDGRRELTDFLKEYLKGDDAL